MSSMTRRHVLAGMAAGSIAVFTPARFAIGAAAKVKVGLMLPYSGTYASLGQNITDGFKLRLAEAGRALDIVAIDDESAPPKAKDNAGKLVHREKVDVLIGTVHSGVAEAMIQVAREEEILTIVPNAGSARITGPLCAPYIFRTSFTNWQAAFPCGEVMAKDSHRRAVALSWNYPAGHEAVAGFRQSFTAAGGTVLKEMLPDFPKMEFQAYLTEIASLKPDAVFAFFSGGGALKFIRDYAAAGLKGKIPLYGSGGLTEGVVAEAGADADGIRTTLHYADDLKIPANQTFRAAFRQMTGREADVFAVQGYDAASLLLTGLDAVKGDLKARKEMVAAMEKMVFHSPRGTFTLSKAHNPVQDIYLREAKGGVDRFVGIAAKALEDPSTGCRMG